MGQKVIGSDAIPSFARRVSYQRRLIDWSIDAFLVPSVSLHMRKVFFGERV